MSEFKLTERQEAAQRVLATDATHLMLYGGSRSGKTFLLVRNVVMRALKAPKSRHAILRFRFNAVKASIIHDTFPKVMETAFPGVQHDLNKTDWFTELPNGSQIWFGGLDDKERTEKILGQEYVTIYLNEASQIPYASRNVALTRLAQKVSQRIDGRAETELRPRMYYDCNPPPKNHWTYKLFHDGTDPDSGQRLPNPNDYDWFQINPESNRENLSEGYLQTLANMSARMQKRFLKGEFADANPSQLFKDEDIDRWRVLGAELPDMVRIVVAVDPSGADDQDNADNDAIGIAVAGLGTDGNGYLLEDCTVKAGPATWGNVATTAYERHAADVVVGETNFGGAMVKYVIQTQRPKTPFKMVTASRGKVQRAEPIAALYETGKIRHVGEFRDLEDELAGFSTSGFLGDKSPNRADAAIWAFTELFPGIVSERKKRKPLVTTPPTDESRGWMGQ
jgi:phage terminase large subunit-like protein